MRHRRPRRGRPGGDFVHHNGLVRRQRALARFQQAFAIRQPLRDAGDHAAGRIARQVADIVAYIHIAAIPGRHVMAIRAAALGRLGDGLAKPAGLRGNADITGARQPHRIAGGKAQARFRNVIDQPDAVRPDDPQAGAARDGGQPRLQRLPLGPAGFSEAGGVDDAAANAGGGAFLNQPLHRFHRHREHGAINRFRQGADRAEAKNSIKRVRFRIDAKNPALEKCKVLRGPRAKRRLVARQPHHRDGSRIDQPAQIVVGVRGTMFFRPGQG